MRKLILHYHLFKNAGSTIDEILKRSFGDAWLSFDKDNPAAKILPSEMTEFIHRNPNARAISSHQVLPPFPQGNFEVFPLIFLRHPLDRARSAYLFEWQKQLGLTEPKGSFSEYVREQLDNGKRCPIANFHVSQLSNTALSGEKPLYDPTPEARISTAKEILEKLPFFGLVEELHESLLRMHFYLKYHFPELKVVNRKINATQDTCKRLDEKLLDIRRQLGEALYGELIDRNQQDLELYKFACAQFNSVVPREG
mgnify:CR=1 FL=1